MKRLYIILLFITIFFQSRAQQLSLSQNQAWEIVKDSILNNRIDEIDVYVIDTLLRENYALVSLEDSIISPLNPSWFFFIDKNPLANWGHSCLYVFVNADNGSIRKYDCNFPPNINLKKFYSSFHSQESLKQKNYNLSIAKDVSPEIISKNKCRLPSSIHHYAVIINGGANITMNYERYWNDCSFIYKTLVDVYGYDKSHIHVLCSDGTDPAHDMRLLNNSTMSSPLDLDGDGTNDIKYSATKNNLDSILTKLSLDLLESDTLFIFSIDHGGLNPSLNESFLCLWNDELVFANEFSQMIDGLTPGALSICMGQCNSGGFIDVLERSGRVIMTACSKTQSSYATSNYYYDEFVYHWTSAMYGETPEYYIVDADSNGNGNISMYEAFTYAKSNDSFYQIGKETPRYSSIPNTLGENLTLGNYWDGYTSIIGTETVCDSAVYEVENLPKEYTIVWDRLVGPATLIPNYTSKNKCLVKGFSTTSNFPLVLKAHILLDRDTIATLEKDIALRTMFGGTYKQESCTFHNITHPSIPETILSQNTTYYVHQGCNVIINTFGLSEMSITHSGITPSYFSINNNKINFSLPYNSGGEPFHIYGNSKVNSKLNFHLLFMPISNNGNISSAGLSISANNNGYTISIKDVNNSTEYSVVKLSDENTMWDLEVYDFYSAEKIFTSHIIGSDYNLITNGWKPSTYILRIMYNNEIFTEKIIIK